MQFTGICDKNGKEIYEGDIIRAVWGLDEIDNLRVFWSEEDGMWVFRDVIDDFGLADMDSQATKIIGNIREHPELITRSNLQSGTLGNGI